MDFAEIRSLVIVALFSEDQLLDQLVLKGGNAINLIYGYGSRSSLGRRLLDRRRLSLIPMKPETYCYGLYGQGFTRGGHEIFDFEFPEKTFVTKDWTPTTGGEGIRLSSKSLSVLDFEQIRREFRRNASRTAIEIGPAAPTDIPSRFSASMNSAGKSGRRNFRITQSFVYTPEMLSLEKLRAICQQMEEYPIATKSYSEGKGFLRYLCRPERGARLIGRSQECLELARTIFAAKDVPSATDRTQSPVTVISTSRIGHRWRTRVSERLKDFNFYVDFVVNESTKLQPLWVV